MSTIYSDLAGELGRLRARLDATIEQLGAARAELADVAKERDALKVQAYEQAALNNRMRAAIDSVRHPGLKRLLWLVPLGENSRYSELMRIVDADETQETLEDLADDLHCEKDGCQAEYLVRRALGLDG